MLQPRRLIKLVRYKKTWALFSTSLVVVFLIMYDPDYECNVGPNQHLSLPHFTRLNQLSYSIHGECPNVLSYMTRGHWKTRPLTRNENEEIENFLKNANIRHNLPPNYERDDKLCGNVTFKGNGTASWFRALCDPKGPNPCCYHNQCVQKSMVECQCETCYDLRRMRHAEYSTWVTSHPACPYKEHSPQEACDILSDARIIFIGDSIIRHVYTAFLLIVTGDREYGAMSSEANQTIRNLCYGMYMFTEKECRLFLETSLHTCKGSVDIELIYYFKSEYAKRLKRTTLSMRQKSFVFMGIGIHDSFQAKYIQKKFLRPTLNCMASSSRKWPRLLWANSHAPGILKSPVVVSQDYDSVKQFNTEMETFLGRWNFPVFNTFNLTDGMTSFDGEHYGMGMNIVKANILLSYIKEMRSREGW